MKLKSIFGTLVAFGAVALMTVGVHAATTFSTETKAGEAGGTVSMGITAQADTGTTDKVNGYILKVKYNPAEITPVAAADDAADATCYATAGTGGFADSDKSVLVADITSTSDTENVLTVAWASATAADVTDVASIMSTIDFKVAETVTSDVKLNVEVVTAVHDENGTIGSYNGGTGTITIDVEQLLGDINLDGVINGTDVTLLTQTVNAVISIDDLNADYPDADVRADVNEDNTINGTDVTLLTQFVNSVIDSFK